MPTLPPPTRKALLKENWEILLKRLTLYSDTRVRRLRWRGVHDGVLPDGYDASGIAAEAISDLLSGKHPWRRQGSSYTQEELWHELMRLASQLVRKLWGWAENTTTDVYDEPDTTKLSKQGNPYASGELHPNQLAERREAQALLAKFRQSLSEYLADEALLAGLVECAFRGESRREKIAQFLRVSPQEVTNARKRLERRLAEYAQLHPECPITLIQELTNA